MKNLFMALMIAAPIHAIAADLRRIDVTDAADMAVAGCVPATPNDMASDQDAFVCALKFLGGTGSCSEAHPGVLHVPSGVFDFVDSLNVRCGVQVVGNGFTSVLNQMKVDWKDKPFVILDTNTILRDLKMDQFQDENGPFVQNGFSVQCQGTDILIEHLMLFKTFRGIAIGGQGFGVGRITLRDISGQPLLVGIAMDNILDVVRVDQVHFWPFWSSAAFVDKFTQTQGVALRTQRNDNPMLTNIFILRYSVGILFATSAWPDLGVSGFTSKAKISHLDCDFCGVGIWMSGDDATDNVVAGFSYLAAGPGQLLPLFVSGQRNKISVSEASVDQLPTNAVRIGGKDNFVRVSEWYVRRWNLAGGTAPAFGDFGTGNKLWVKDSYGRWPGTGFGTCAGAQSCDFALGQNF